jgi:hypothetical protein
LPHKGAKYGRFQGLAQYRRALRAQSSLAMGARLFFVEREAASGGRIATPPLKGWATRNVAVCAIGDMPTAAGGAIGKFDVYRRRPRAWHPVSVGVGFSVALLLVVSSLTAFAQPKSPDVEQIQLTVHPSSAPVPAMRYHFLPDLVDQIPGNAALLYLNAAQQMSIARAADPLNSGDDEKIFQWLATPIKDLPKDQVRALLDRYAPALNQMRLASLRDRCDFDPPFRTEGFRTLLPYLVDARALSRLACLSARLKIANGELDAAAGEIALPEIQAGHLNQGGPFLIQVLVAASCEQLSLAQMQDLIAQDHSPNLYWALGDLPSSLVNARGTLKMERAGAYFSMPQLKDARAGKITPEQWRATFGTMTEIRNNGLHSYGESEGTTQVMAALFAVKEYPIARRYLLDQNMSEKEIDAMSVSQALGLYRVGQFEFWSQELDKCLTLPFWQGFPLLVRAEDQMRRGRDSSPWNLPAQFIPAFKTAYANLARTDRRIALLRTVEAIRAYAAGHDGQPPARLADLNETPAPLDPMTGHEFKYQAQGDDVMIEAPAIDLAAPDPTGIRITLKIVK